MPITVNIASIWGVDAVVVNVLPLNRDPDLQRVTGKGGTPVDPTGLDVPCSVVVLVVAVDMSHLV